ncbi:MAG: bifunctional diaminohydroxyphosphoribosylaminopyrimidine deaminase/5-amino-6-(5-phosphoribosylamino)uracil reductase RibD [Gammaproteobacteria bacterium]|nr:bifunctional diaminohydroxyphosphoribosylaminopyrimidine deaminase/5-amino-6-(5-phosphoribosylamino)uracil reductase RibD [Gammaproteobacteria bacterium]
MSDFMPHDSEMMRRALRLAERGLYTTDPNPRVGCVLVRDGVIVGEGWHAVAGGPHAEIVALQQAGEQARGATAYVTLEPCCHHGKTPPCSEALIAAGVARVIAAMEDPNPLVAGQGLAQLRAAGIATASGLLAAQAEALNPGFVQRMRLGRPYIRCKLAMSLDGRTAMASGESQWITGPAAREDVHRLRARSSAIMSGIGTVLKDDPSLTVRLEGEVAVKPPLRIVLDPHLSTPEQARFLQQPGESLIVTACTEEAVQQRLRQAGAEVLCLPNGHDAVDLVALMRVLAERGINEILMETGAILSGALLHAGIIDELIVYMAPKLMGDKARGLFHTPGLDLLADAVALEIQDIRAVGDDWRITAKIKEVAA